MAKTPNLSGLIAVLYATEDEDVTLGTMASMPTYGQKLADEMGCTITARDPTSDRIYATFEPACTECGAPVAPNDGVPTCVGCGLSWPVVQGAE